MVNKSKVFNTEMQEEMVGLLMAISIVSKRLANRLLQFDRHKLEEKSARKSDVEVKT